MSFNIKNSDLKKITDPENKLIEIFGFPDAGTSSSVLLIARTLIQKYGVNVIYVVPPQKSMSHDYLNKLLGKYKDNFRILFIEDYNAQKLLKTIDDFASEANYVIIDDFAHYILNHTRSVIKTLLSDLFSKAAQYSNHILVVNQLRYDTTESNFHDFEKEYGRFVALYKKYLKQYVQLRLYVNKTNETDITVSEFSDRINNKKHNASSNITDFMKGLIDKL